MALGTNILNNRKKNNLSQEQLAEKINVTRQTISNWELGETSPNPEQLKLLSKCLMVSIDELLDNDVNSILVKKVSNTEKLAGIIIKILQIGAGIMITIIVMIIAIIIIFSIKFTDKSDKEIAGKVSISCNLDNEEYTYEAEYNKDYQVINMGGDAWITNRINVEEYEDVNKLTAHIEDYFNEHNGSCKIINKEN